MLYNLNYWINDSHGRNGATIIPPNNIIPKFRYLAANPTSQAHLNLHLFGAVTNNRPVLTSDYNNLLSRPLTSVRVGFGGESVSVLTNPYGESAGYYNYPRFINSIMGKHKLKSTFWPMGVNFTQGGNLQGNAVTCNLAVTEQFSLTFVEVPVGFPSTWTDPQNGREYTNTYSMSTVFHIETTQPFSLISWAEQFQNIPGPTAGFSIIKGRGQNTWLNAINWQQYNGRGLPNL